MDPDRWASLYAAGYQARRPTPGGFAAPTSIGRASTAPTSTSAALRRSLGETGEISISDFLLGLGKLVWAWIWHYIVRQALWVLFHAALVLVVMGTIYHFTDYVRWTGDRAERLRELYDDVALESSLLLSCEQTWASFKRWKRRMLIAARTNWFTDKLALLQQEARIWYDRTMWFLLWVVLPMSGLIAAACYSLENRVGHGKFTLRKDLKGPLVVGLPEWLIAGKHWEGSDSNYGPPAAKDVQMQIDQELPVAEAKTEWITVTEAQLTPVDPDVKVSMTYPPLVASESSVTIVKTSSVTSGPPVSRTPQHDKPHETATASQMEDTPDFWAPPEGKTTIEQGRRVWCRKCRQFHCCELPY
ncbi:hypothetical protein KC332_g14007 [Hortaea werneckii]|nr:hypothetical protein KC329_g15597 [Hortaea werneckii]KAI7262456.1 hypothetical protein KC335_g10244 [Hortaea werneckii]KAI7390307.1 hypothetical protein KC332_g14007 [Hortaea werneckii]KAI7412602.1 hypothetical protein KC336_g11643 [Hortaea werneckii]KAI7433963.1 hypothetical protein KC368_g14785 [Hortaea werneckii]